jgi:hypothetical protein
VSEADRISAGAAVVCVLAVVSSTGPEADAVVTTVVLCVLVAGALACVAGYCVHVRRIRRDIEAGRAMVMRRESTVPRAAVCRCTQRGSCRRARCRPGRTRYR